MQTASAKSRVGWTGGGGGGGGGARGGIGTLCDKAGYGQHSSRGCRAASMQDAAACAPQLQLKRLFKIGARSHTATETK